MKDRYKVIIAFVFTVVVIGLMVNAVWDTYRKDVIVQTNYYDCYRVTAPFGVFAVEGDGEIDGFIAFHGNFEFELREEYVVKYFDGNEIKTKICDAEKTSLIVDGTFRLEVNKIGTARFKVGSDEPIKTPTFNMDGYPKYAYKIYIPYLPNVPQITDDWITD